LVGIAFRAAASFVVERIVVGLRGIFGIEFLKFFIVGGVFRFGNEADIGGSIETGEGNQQGNQYRHRHFPEIVYLTFNVALAYLNIY